MELSSRIQDSRQASRALQRKVTRPKAENETREKARTPIVPQPGWADPRSMSQPNLLALQRTIGNQAVSRLIQRKLTVGAANDPYEREADRAAEQVVRAEGGRISPPSVQRQGEEEVQTEALVQREAEEEEEVQTKRGVISNPADSFEAGGEFESRLSATRGGGSPLPDNVRGQMEAGFGADFSGVRVHTDATAGQLNRAVSAQAFTHGQDIYLGAGKGDFQSSEGQKLIAHELAHTIQQTGLSRNPNPISRHIQRKAAMVLDVAHLRSFTQAGTTYTVSDTMVGPKLKKGDQIDVTTPEVSDASRNWLKAKTMDAQPTEGFIRAAKIEYQPSAVNLENVPLTWGDLLEARKSFYEAAIQVIRDVQGGGGQNPRAAALIGAFDQEKENANPPERKSLMEALARGEMGKKKMKKGESDIKPFFSKQLPGDLAKRIAAEVGGEAGDIQKRLMGRLALLLNRAHWTKFTNLIDIQGQQYASTFTPLNKEFDPTYHPRGTTGYASMTAKVGIGTEGHQMSEASKGRATNAWYTQFSKGQAADGEVLFAAFRSGALMEEGLQGDIATRRRVAAAKAKDLLQGMAIQYFRSRTEEDQAKMLAGTLVPTIPVVSTALLTPRGVGRFWDKEGSMLQEHHAALESFHDQETEFAVMTDRALKKITVKFNIINFNKAVNIGRVTGSNAQQNAMNAEALARLEQLKIKGLAELDNKMQALELWKQLVGIDPAHLNQITVEQQMLLKRKIKIQGLWARLQAMKSAAGSGSGSLYELPAVASNLGFQLGAMVHYNCKSGKDRTGAADFEAKLLAFQMENRAQAAGANLPHMDPADVVPKYGSALTPDDAEAAAKLLMEAGNLDVQKFNTAFAGSKVVGSQLGISEFNKRLLTILAQPRGQETFRQYLLQSGAMADRVKDYDIKVKEALSLFMGLSKFTGS